MSRVEITALLRARNTLLIVQTDDEASTESAIIDACADAKYPVRLWDCSQGLTEASGKAIDSDLILPAGILECIRDRKDRAAYVLRDFSAFWRDAFPARALKTIARALLAAPADNARAIIVLVSTTAEIPAEFKGQIPVVKWGLPSRADMGKLLDQTVASLPEQYRANAAPNGTRAAAIDAAMGLTYKQAQDCFSLSLVKERAIVPALVSAAKKQIIASGKGLTWEDPDPRGMDAVGGLANVKAWLTRRRAAFGEKAREYGIKPPKGLFLVGLPGTGKTLVSKCVAAAYGIPLIALNMGELKGKYVGESEANIRAALAMLEAIAPCVVRVDEIEKALAGASGEGGDGGVSADALGTFLSWMQDRKAPVFVIATANDVRGLPPELLRKGRFDEIFFVDLPTREERTAIVRASLVANNRGEVAIDHGAVADATNGFSGAEIAALVPDAMFAAFDDGAREITTTDLTTAASETVPLSKTAEDKIKNLREWAKTRARFATTPETQTSGPSRALDL